MILQIHTSRMTLSEDVNLEEFVTAKDELSGADIKVGLFTDILSHVIINLFEVMVEKNSGSTFYTISMSKDFLLTIYLPVFELFADTFG